MTGGASVAGGEVDGVVSVDVVGVVPPGTVEVVGHRVAAPCSAVDTRDGAVTLTHQMEIASLDNLGA